MKIKITLLFVCLLMIVFSTNAFSASNTVWKITYASGPFTGGFTTLYLAPAAIKIKTASKYEIYAKAPTWNADVFSLKGRSMCTVPYSTYSKGRFFFENEESANELDPSKVISTEAITLFGFPAKRQSWKTVSDDPSYYRIRTKPAKVITKLSTTTQIPHNKMQIALLAAWIPLPHLNAVPLLLSNEHEDGHLESRYLALKIEQISFSPGDFHPPAGFKRVKRSSQLLTAQYSNVIEKLLDDEKAFDAKKMRRFAH